MKVVLDFWETVGFGCLAVRTSVELSWFNANIRCYLGNACLKELSIATRPVSTSFRMPEIGNQSKTVFYIPKLIFCFKHHNIYA